MSTVANTSDGKGLQEFTVELLHKGEVLPQVIELQDFSADAACRRARSAMFMMALRDGREYRLDDLEARIYDPARYRPSIACAVCGLEVSEVRDDEGNHFCSAEHRAEFYEEATR